MVVRVTYIPAPPPCVLGWGMEGGALVFPLPASAGPLLTGFAMAGEDTLSLPTLKLLLVGDSAVGKSRCKPGEGIGGVPQCGKRAVSVAPGRGAVPVQLTCVLSRLFSQSVAEIH